MNLYRITHTLTIILATSLLQASEPNKELPSPTSISVDPITEEPKTTYCIERKRHFPPSDSTTRSIMKTYPTEIFKDFLEGKVTVINYPCDHPNVYDRDSDYNSLLHHAPSKETAQLLIDKGLKAFIDHQNRYGKTPLHIAIEKKNYELIQLFLACGARPLIQNCKKQNCILAATTHNDYELLIFLIKQCATMLNIASLTEQDYEGKTLLMYAVQMNNVTMTTYFLKETGLKDEKDMDGCTALHHAQSAEMTEILLAAGMQVDAQNKYGQTPIRQACLLNKPIAMIRTLLANGASATQGDSEPESLLHVTSDKQGDSEPESLLHATSDPQVAALLLQCGVLINSRNSYGKTPLHNAVQKNRYLLVEYLITQRADIHAQDKGGKTPLHYAKSTIITKKLLESGANPNSVDNDGNTPMHMTFSNYLKLYWADLLRLYSTYNGKLDRKNNHHESIAYLAVKTQAIDVTNYLQEQLAAQERPTKKLKIGAPA